MIAHFLLESINLDYLRNMDLAIFAQRQGCSISGCNGCTGSFTGHQRTEFIGNFFAMHDAVEVLHFVLHDAMQPHRRSLAGTAIGDGAIHFGAVIDTGTIIVLFLALMHQIMLFLAVSSLNSHADIAHINPDSALGALDQNIVFRPAETPDEDKAAVSKTDEAPAEESNNDVNAEADSEKADGAEKEVSDSEESSLSNEKSEDTEEKKSEVTSKKVYETNEESDEEESEDFSVFD